MTSCSSTPAATRSMTPAQSPGGGWRKRRAVGYQGVVSVCCIQRQSARWGSRIQTGLAMAPARWAMQVSVVMTRSSVATQRRRFSQVAVMTGAVQNGNVGGQSGHLLRGLAFLKRNPGDAEQSQQRQQV